MAGRKALDLSRKILQALGKGPRHRNDLERELLLDPVYPNRHLTQVLADMRMAGLIESVGRGSWRIAEGYCICPHCGQGLVKDVG